MNKIIKIIFLDILKSKIVIAYTIILAILSWSSFALEGNASKGILTVLNVILFTVPLVSILFSTIYIYNSSEFIEMILSQPVKREKIWIGIFSGLSLSLCLAFLLGSGISLLVYSFDSIGFMMILMGLLITIIFVSLACLCSILTRDKTKGIGLSIMIWLYFAILFDGIILFLLFQFSDYPIEKTIVGITTLNPIDLARIQILMQLEVSAMMGYTGAIFKNLLGTSVGLLISFVLLCLWFFVPFYISKKKFAKKDL
ncbi:ABC transporter permease [Flavobacterium sp. I3-2]|uniref:ABC transporter permease n=1 Tax=Flavobacterium sp. I3-2 TaxID=2748319 RepID=UPI0015B0C251|nr:ABC transporter permease subunit [Flavobacterium sp. I3-2]